jgi:hypothetical protein
MKLKTADLTRQALNWAVAEAANADAHTVSLYRRGKTLTRMDTDAQEYWSPSTDWSQGGPIIEREKIATGPYGDQWYAQSSKIIDTYYGPTPLIAAMRCYVASRLGDEVEVPEEMS